MKNDEKWERINSSTSSIGDLLQIKWLKTGRYPIGRFNTGRVFKHSNNRIFIEFYSDNNRYTEEIPYTKIISCYRKVETDVDLGI